MSPRKLRPMRTTTPGQPARRLHPWPVRIMHWINAAAMLIMITSGWGIYNDDVIIRGLHFSEPSGWATGRPGA